MIGQTPPETDRDEAAGTDASVAGGDAAPAATPASKPALPREIGGRDGPEPTRYGDWEKNGRCIDF